jgi:hypothetical protein
MADILTPQKKQSKTSLGERPNFNDFDKQVVGWDLSMSNSIDQEDTFVIRFAGLPSYNGSIVSLGQKVTLKFQNKQIDMIIRNIRTSQRHQIRDNHCDSWHNQNLSGYASEEVSDL